MELPGNTRIDDDRCFYLLWKGIFIDSWDPDHIPSGDGPLTGAASARIG